MCKCYPNFILFKNTKKREKRKSQEKKTILLECYLCIKHFEVWLFLFSCCCPWNLLKVDSVNSDGNIELSCQRLRTFSRCSTLFFQSTEGDYSEDCGMKVNVRITIKKSDILSAFRLSGSSFVALVNFFYFGWAIWEQWKKQETRILTCFSI